LSLRVPSTIHDMHNLPTIHNAAAPCTALSTGSQFTVAASALFL